MRPEIAVPLKGQLNFVTTMTKKQYLKWIHHSQYLSCASDHHILNRISFGKHSGSWLGFFKYWVMEVMSPDFLRKIPTTPGMKWNSLKFSMPKKTQQPQNKISFNVFIYLYFLMISSVIFFSLHHNLEPWRYSGWVKMHFISFFLA